MDWDAVLRSRDLDDPTADKEVTNIAVEDKFGELEEEEEGSEDSKVSPSEPVSAALTIGLIGTPFALYHCRCVSDLIMIHRSTQRGQVLPSQCSLWP